MLEDDGTSFLENDSVNHQFQVASKTFWLRRKGKMIHPPFIVDSPFETILV